MKATVGKLYSLVFYIGAGLVLGPVLIFIVHEKVVGFLPGPIMIRGSFFAFVSVTFPLAVVPLTTLLVALIKSPSLIGAFRRSLAFTLALLVPVPLVYDWKTIPGVLGYAEFSREMSIQISLSLVALVILALIASAFSTFAGMWLSRVAHRDSPPRVT